MYFHFKVLPHDWSRIIPKVMSLHLLFVPQRAAFSTNVYWILLLSKISPWGSDIFYPLLLYSNTCRYSMLFVLSYFSCWVGAEVAIFLSWSPDIEKHYGCIFRMCETLTKFSGHLSPVNMNGMKYYCFQMLYLKLLTFGFKSLKQRISCSFSHSSIIRLLWGKGVI